MARKKNDKQISSFRTINNVKSTKRIVGRSALIFDYLDRRTIINYYKSDKKETKPMVVVRYEMAKAIRQLNIELEKVFYIKEIVSFLQKLLVYK